MFRLPFSRRAKWSWSSAVDRMRKRERIVVVSMNDKAFHDRVGPAVRNGGFRMADYWVWCGSVIRGADGLYHMFASRWSKTLPFNPGWLTSSEVVRAVATTPRGPYRMAEVVLPARGAEYWDGRGTHNPFITRSGDDYLLYYSGTTHPFPDVRPGEPLGCDDPRVLITRSNQRVGLATSKSVLGPWTRMDRPILPTRPNTFYSFFTSNPSPCVERDGSISLIFKGRQYIENDFSPMTFGLARAAHWGASYEVITRRPLFSLTEVGELEDPFLWRGDDGDYRMLAKDMTGNICGETGGGLLARSADALDWQVERGRPAYSRSIVWDDGSRERLGALERPFLLIEDDGPTHLFAAAGDGPGGFANARNSWNLVMPLKA